MEIGITQKLKAVKASELGYYLEDDAKKTIILPKTSITTNINIGDYVEVFVYTDPQDNLVATTSKPYIQFEEFAYLQVKKTNADGVFVDWGLNHDLFVPKEEQVCEMEEGKSYLIFLLKDEITNRLFGSCKENEFVFFDEIDVKEGDEVDLLLYKMTDLGMNAIVNNKYKGLVFNSNIHKKIQPGDILKGYVKLVREDGKIDLLLEPPGYKKSIDKSSEIILDALHQNNGFLNISDKSSPETIKKVLGLSKKAFKKSLGNLYKQQVIEIQDNGIKLS